VHRRDCPNVPDLATDRERLMDVEWSGEPGTPFMVAIAIEALDRKHLLRDITAVLGDLHINILSANVTTRSDRVAMLTFNFELADPTHLEYAMRSIRDVPGVYDAYRLVQA
jgi:GTP pyrophosphokinase